MRFFRIILVLCVTAVVTACAASRQLTENESTVLIALFACLAPTIASLASLYTAIKSGKRGEENAKKLNRILASPAVDMRKHGREGFTDTDSDSGGRRQESSK